MGRFLPDRPRIAGVISALTIGAATAAEVLPEPLAEQLQSEAYPDRVAAQEALLKWAIEKGEKSRPLLLDLCRTSGDPEIRKRSLNVLKEVVLRDLRAKRPGFVGIQMASIQLPDSAEMEGFGVEIRAVNPETPAEEAGLKVLDVIVSLNGNGWKEPRADHQFGLEIGKLHGGDQIQLEIFRKGELKQIEVILAPRPWSIGLYSENLRVGGDRRFRGDPFAARRRNLPDEEHAQDEVFRDWLATQPK